MIGDYEITLLTLLGKEDAFVLIIIMLVVKVNNSADTITSVLLADRYEDCSVTQQRERPEILFDIALIAPHITANTSVYSNYNIDYICCSNSANYYYIANVSFNILMLLNVFKMYTRTLHNTYMYVITSMYSECM